MKPSLGWIALLVVSVPSWGDVITNTSCSATTSIGVTTTQSGSSACGANAVLGGLQATAFADITGTATSDPVGMNVSSFQFDVAAVSPRGGGATATATATDTRLFETPGPTRPGWLWISESDQVGSGVAASINSSITIGSFFQQTCTQTTPAPFPSCTGNGFFNGNDAGIVEPVTLGQTFTFVHTVLADASVPAEASTPHSALDGQFYFSFYFLEADYSKAAPVLDVTVPEPHSMSIVGLGLTFMVLVLWAAKRTVRCRRIVEV